MIWGDHSVSFSGLNASSNYKHFLITFMCILVTCTVIQIMAYIFPFVFFSPKTLDDRGTDLSWHFRGKGWPDLS